MLDHSCRNELRLCDQTLMYDNSFGFPIEEFHSVCDSVIGTSITTPATSTLTTTFDPQACDIIYTACQSAFVLRSSCKSSASADRDLLACICQPQITTLYSVCYYDRNVSCVLELGAINAVPGRTFCNEFHSATVSLKTTTSRYPKSTNDLQGGASLILKSRLLFLCSSLAHSCLGIRLQPTIHLGGLERVSATFSGHSRCGYGSLWCCRFVVREPALSAKQPYTY
jgi:hypothetical protein